MDNERTMTIIKLYSKNYSIQNISDSFDILVEEVKRRLTLKNSILIIKLYLYYFYHKIIALY